MNDGSHTTCPECGSGLESGFVSYGSGLVWHKTQLRGLQRVFVCAFATGRAVVGNWISTGLMTSCPAMMCETCGTVVLPRAAAGRSE
ncbi:MAG: PF20097 family protein [Planctomycetota bacterium]